ncbi:hypothetical protein EJ04DRAFT_365605 [Polyplosphaeria fusca]|uniref:Uncharacterized protein n=1 Tax=Polyplosphaeria fusca TaxID=682080 RepID=A0A9P4QUH0_9PLEO|nr:hypothetical protein EJ04DRAFT_365605 [Polyplosphaeria fusca]
MDTSMLSVPCYVSTHTPIVERRRGLCGFCSVAFSPRLMPRSSVPFCSSRLPVTGCLGAWGGQAEGALLHSVQVVTSWRLGALLVLAAAVAGLCIGRGCRSGHGEILLLSEMGVAVLGGQVHPLPQTQRTRGGRAPGREASVPELRLRIYIIGGGIPVSNNQDSFPRVSCRGVLLRCAPDVHTDRKPWDHSAGIPHKSLSLQPHGRVGGRLARAPARSCLRVRSDCIGLHWIGVCSGLE